MVLEASTMAEHLSKADLLTFGTLSLVRRQLHGYKSCYVNHVVLLHWNSIAISCFIRISG